MENQEIGAPDGGPIGIIHSPDSASSGLVWLVRTAQESNHASAENRVLTGISGDLARAAIQEAEVQPDPQYANAFFALHLYAHVIAGETQKVRDLTKASVGRMLRNLTETNPAVAHGVRSMLTNLEAAPGHACPGAIDRFAWSLLFPSLPGFWELDADPVSYPMQLFRNAVVEGWSKAPGGADVFALTEYLRQMEASKFANLRGINQKEARRAYLGWLAYALREGAVRMGNAACSITAKCLKRPLAEPESTRLQLIYGPSPLAGRANLHFVRQIVRVNADVHGLLLEVLGFLPPEEMGKKYKRLENLLTAVFYMLMHRREEDARRKNRDSKAAELDEKTVEATALLAPPEAAENAEGLTQILAAISTLPDQDQELIRERVEGLDPKDIAARHPDWKLNNKQIADRYRDLCRKIRKDLGI